MLTDRKRSILQIIVDEYINTPVPVASEGVAQKMPVEVSSATIRHDMAELEEDGYTTRPHSSAGSVPSDKAYRAYVESLDAVMEPSRRVQQLVRRRFRQTHMDIDTWSQLAVQLLAGLVRTMALATPPRAAEARWKHLNLVHLHEFLALVVMVLQESRLKQQLVPLKEPTTQGELTQISNKLNAGFAGLSCPEVWARNVELTPFEEEVTSVALNLLEADQEEGVPVHYVDGLRHMFNYPELSMGSRAREIAELLEDQQVMRTLLGKAPDAGVVRVTIGRENKTDLLHPFSIVFARYGLPSKASGVVGIVGPTRMEYATAISSVRYLSSVMSEMMGVVQGVAP